MRSVITLILSCVILWSCSQSETTGTTITVEYVDDPVKASQFLGGYNVFYLQTSSPDAYVRSVESAMFTQDRVFVFDQASGKVISFDRDGRFLGSTANMIGRGPNEYVRLIDVALDKQRGELLLQCDSPYRIIALDLDLKFKRKYDLDFYFTQIAVDDKYVYGVLPDNADAIQDDEADYLIALNKDDLTGDKKVLIKTKYNAPSIGVKGELLSSNGKIFLGTRFENTIYQIKDGELVDRYVLDFGDKNLPETFVDDVGNPALFFEKYKNCIYSITNIYASDSLMLFNTNKPYMFIFNNKTRTCKAYKGFVNDILSISSTMSIPLQGMQSCVIYNTPTMILNKYKEMTQKDTSFEVNRALMEIVEKVDQNSNPVLIAWEIK